MGDLYHRQANLDRLIKKVEASEKISEKDKQAIFGFRDDCFSRGLSIGRIYKHIRILMSISEWLGKEFADADKDDIKRIVAVIEQSQYSEWTKYGYKVTIRIFYRWIRKMESYPEEVKWLKLRIKLNKTRLPEEMLTEEEVKKLISSTEDTRERAIVSVLYESGCRIGELLNMKLKNVSFDKYGARIMVSGKSGPRVVRIIATAPYLAEWINKHPHQEDPEAPLWVQKKTEKPLGYNGVTRILQALAKRSDIKKKVNPHNFRHSRATHLANHLTEAQMKEYFGWVQDSGMASVYVHLSGRDMDKALLNSYGIKEQENGKPESKFSPKKCIRCSEMNPPTNEFCSKCGLVLSEKRVIKIIEMDEERKEADQVLDKLIQDQEFRDILIQKIRGLAT